MNQVEVIGGKAKERQVVEQTILWCTKKLLPRVRTLDIEVRLTNCSDYGYCMPTENHKTFELEIKKGMSLYDLISTVCHEMVHIKQYYKKELSDGKNGARWKSKNVSYKTDYFNQPWEKEAFRMEESLALECFKQLNVSL